MKPYILFFFAIWPGVLFSQTTTWNDTFSDGDLSANPEWTGDLNEFTIFDDSGNNVLRLNDTDASNSSTQLRTESTAAYGGWEFFVRMDFNPSSSNYADVYLLSDQSDLQNDLNGYFIRIGGTADEVSLFRQDGSSTQKIIDGTDGTVSTNPVNVRVKVLRDNSGNWEILIDSADTGNFESQGSVLDNNHTTSTHFGLVTNYTSTRSQLFYFDDFGVNIFKAEEAQAQSNQTVDVSFNFPIDGTTLDNTDFSLSEGLGSPQQTQLINSGFTARLTYGQDIPSQAYTLTISNIEDTFGNSIAANSQISFTFANPFELTSATSSQNNQALLTFSENLNTSTVETSGFSINGTEADASTTISFPENNQILLTFPDPLPSGNVQLEISEIESVNGWAIPSGSSASFFIYDTYQSGDIVINEFMKDPPTGTAEYVELRNTSSRYLNLKDWQVGDENNLTSISSTDFTMLPDSFVVISADTAALFSYYGSADYAQASLPALNNGSDEIRVYAPNGSLIDSLAYDANWGGVDVAIERRSASVATTFPENWGDSPASDFGTPGFSNLVQPDQTVPDLSSFEQISGNQLRLIFSERIQSAPAEELSSFSLSADNISNPPSLQSATYAAPDTILLAFDADLPSQPQGTTYELSITNQADIFDNVADEITESLFIIEYAEADSGDVFITEFVFRPTEGFTDFIELYNPTESAMNLQGWTYNDNLRNPRTIADQEFPLLPNERVILAPDSALLDLFPDAKLIDMGSGFSNLNSTTPDDIVIRNASGTLLDSLTYLPNWGGEETSLERRSIEVSGVFRENWGNSPAEELATPGAENQIAPDETPPKITRTQAISDDQIRVLFSESVQADQASTLANFSLSVSSESVNPPALQSIEIVAPDTLILSFEDILPREPSGTTYELTASNQTDIFGNVATSLISTFFLIDYAEADSGEVFITEFMYDPTDLFSEFVELYNATDSAFSLRNWTFNDNSGNRRVIAESDVSLQPGEYFIITPDSVIFESFPDINFLAIGSRFSALNNSTDAIVIRNENGLLIDSLTYFSSWGGDEVSLERRSNEFPSYFKENWGDSPSEDGATPGIPNEVPQDETPPTILSFTALNDSTVQVIYSERVQAAAATELTNYDLAIPTSTWLSYPELDSVRFLPPDTVLLYYGHILPRDDNGTTLNFIISNQTDIFGNVANPIQKQLFMIDLSETQPGDVVINEFMYDPEGQITEFVELYNHTDRNFDLSGWLLNDNTGNRRTITDTNFELPTNSYVILAPDSTLMQQFPSRDIIVMGSRFSSLNNSTDAIVISNADSVIIDSLTYSSNWGGEGVSLERLSPTAPSVYRENWADSPSESGSTPGRRNQVQPDETPPEVVQASYTSADSIRITFSERVDSELANQVDSYSISPSQGIREVTRFAGNSVFLVLESGLTDGTNYTVTVTNQQDIFGNVMSSGEASFEYVLLSEVEPKEVIINEILYRRATADSEEFIELYNRTDSNFDLSGWTFSDATGSANIPSGTQIRGGEYLVLIDSEPESPAKMDNLQLENAVYVPGFPSLNDDEDAVVIKNRNGVVIDSLFYNETWGGNQPGISLERKDPLSASNDGSNWASSTSESGNSAGRQSSVYQPDETPPEIIFAKLQPNGKILVAFSEFVTIENTNVFVNEEPVAITGYSETSANIVILGEDPFPSGEPLLVTFSQVLDFRGNESTEEISVEVSQPLAPGNVVINEIMFNPLANADDNLPDQTEYIELYNRSEYAVSLEGFYLHDEPDENNETRNIFPITSQFKWIPPGEYALVYAENQASEFAKSQLAAYFEMEEADDQFFIRIDRSSLSLASSDDAIYLADSTGTTIDSVFYDESWQNPNLYDTDGVAIERIDPNGPSNDESNWSSSTRVNGGTPGEQNSIFQQSGAGPEDTGISFSPNPFSPDDDSFGDNLFINYKLEEPDYLLRVRIFDRYGREVRELADGKQAGFEGSLIWDGLTDDNRKNRVGIYIVLFEAYNSANGKDRTFKKTVVLARKF